LTVAGVTNNSVFLPLPLTTIPRAAISTCVDVRHPSSYFAIDFDGFTHLSQLSGIVSHVL
jgi:hypothetical protein